MNVAVLFGGVDPAESRRTVIFVAFPLVAPAVGVALPAGSAAAFSAAVALVPFVTSTAASAFTAFVAALAFALDASEPPLGVVVFFGVAAVRAIFRTGIVVRHSTGMEVRADG